MSRWGSIRVREELLARLKVHAKQEGRSTASFLDFLLSSELDARAGRADVRHHGRTLAPAPARAPVALHPEQTTVDEMLVSCPNCAGEMLPYCLDDDKGGGEMTVRCEDCGYVREET